MVSSPRTIKLQYSYHTTKKNEAVTAEALTEITKYYSP